MAIPRNHAAWNTPPLNLKYSSLTFYAFPNLTVTTWNNSFFLWMQIGATFCSRKAHINRDWSLHPACESYMVGIYVCTCVPILHWRHDTASWLWCCRAPPPLSIRSFRVPLKIQHKNEKSTNIIDRSKSHLGCRNPRSHQVSRNGYADLALSTLMNTMWGRGGSWSYTSPYDF